MTKHVVQIVQHLRPGGIECMVLDLASHGSSPTTIVSLEGDPRDAFGAWPRLRAFQDRIAFLEKPAGLSASTVPRLTGLLRRLQATAVHTHHIGPLLYGGIAARLAGVRRVVHTEHDAWHLVDPRRRRLEKALLAVVQPTLVADSAMVARSLRSTLGDRPMHTIDNGIDVGRYKPADRLRARRALGLPVDAMIVGTAARLEPVKGVDLLIEAVTAVPHLHLAIAGDGSQREALRTQAHALGVADRVSFIGCLDDTAAFYPALDRFCLASRHEGLPLSLLEAQACNIPAIVTPVGAMADAVAPGAGAVAGSVSARAVADAIQCSFVASDSSSPRDHIVRHFSLETMVSAYQELWHERSDTQPPRLAAA